MAGRIAARSATPDVLDFVEHWEELPEGNWLENDEDGVHWYLTDDGQHWHSTDDGYRLWVDDQSPPGDEQDVRAAHAEDEGHDDNDDEEHGPVGPRPRLGEGTTILSTAFALLVFAWTLFITVPTADDALSAFTSESPVFSADIDRVMSEKFELHQTLNTLTLVLAALTAIVGLLSLAQKVPWWAVMTSQVSLFMAMFSASWTGLSAEHGRWEACDPLVYYCYQMEPSSAGMVPAIYPTMLACVVALFTVHRSLRAWAHIDSQDEPIGEGQIRLFSRDAPRLGGFPAVMGLLMSTAVAAFTHLFAVPATEENIETFGGPSSPQGELFQSVQVFNELVVNASILVMVVSLLTLLRKLPWWALPASVLPLISLQFMAIGESQFNGLSAIEQDPFYTGVCSMLGMAIIGMSAFRTVMDHEWEEDEDDFDLYEDSGGQKRYDFFDEDEKDHEWRFKIASGAMVGLLMLAAVGGFLVVQHSMGPSGEPAFQIRDANGTLSENMDDLVVIDMLDKSTKYSEETIRISLQLNDLEERYECSWRGSGACTFEYLEIFDDRRLTAFESILISEGVELCSGGDEPCSITAHISQERYEEDEDMMETLETTDLGSYTVLAV